MNTLAKRFAQHWKERQFPRKSKMLLALSGGIDSMVLACLLREAGIPFVAAHCNFSLRPEADGDEAFVIQWCREQGLELHTARFDTAAHAAAQGQSIQVAARVLRYDWFEQLRKQHHYTCILTAHHADDVAETLLLHLCRGTGLRGLHGIPEQNGALIRPLLFARRAEIEAYAGEHHLAWREDSSNAEDKYLRNAFRLRVMPLLEELAPGAAGRMALTAQHLQGAGQLYKHALKRRLSRLMEPRGRDFYLPLRLWQKQEALPTLAFELFHPFGFSPEQIPQILELMQAESGRQILSHTHRVLRHRDFLVLHPLDTTQHDLILIETIPAKIESPVGTFFFEWTTPPLQIPEDPNQAYINSAAVRLPLILRPRREGDYFYPFGMGMKKKKLKRFLIDQKLGLHEKDRIRVLECAGKILWVAGQRIDERFKLHPGSTKALKIVFQARD